MQETLCSVDIRESPALVVCRTVCRAGRVAVDSYASAMTDPKDIPPSTVVSPRVVQPASSDEESVRQKIAMIGARRFDVEPGDVHVEQTAESFGWCHAHRVMRMWTLAIRPPRKTRVFVTLSGEVVHIVEGHPNRRLGEITNEMLVSASAILRPSGLLDSSVPAASLASGFVDVMCYPRLEIATRATAKSIVFGGGRGYPIETWISPSGEAGLDVVRRCSRDPEIEWSTGKFCLKFYTFGSAIESWRVVGNREQLLEANAEIEVPNHLYPPRA